MPSLRSQLKDEDSPLLSAFAEPTKADKVLALLTPMQRSFVEDKSRNKIARCTRRSGKCLKEGTDVLTPNGPVPIEQLKPGDTVYGYNSDGTVSPTRVTALHDQGVKDVVDLLSHGAIIATATKEHRWLTWRVGQSERVRRTHNLNESVKVRREFVAIPGGQVHEPHAYAIGALLGDGCTKDARPDQKLLSSETDEIPRRVAAILNAPYFWRGRLNLTWCLSSLPQGTGRGRSAEVTCNYYDEWMRGRGSADKRIDFDVVNQWDRNSAFALLGGLLDTDGSVGVYNNRLTVRWSSNSLSIADGIARLLYKFFQIRVVVTKEHRANHFTVTVANNLHAARVVSALSPHVVLERKKWRDEYENLPQRNSIERTIGLKSGREYRSQCWDITVDNDTHLFVLANEGLVTHNTFMIAAYMISECLKAPRTPVLYAGLTRDSAKEAVWPILIEMLDELDIEHTAHESKLQIVFPHRSKITIFGCDMENARNRLRGRKFKLVCFDETGFYAKLDPLVTAVVPMLADFGGTLCLTSSPGELLQGFFYEADQGKRRESWSRYSWSINDNPHFQKPAYDPKYKTRAEEELATVLAMQFHGNATHPGYRREWLGEWVSDHTALVYPISDANLIPHLYKMALQQHAIGISFSPFVSSIVVGRFSEFARDFQIIDAKELEDLDLDSFAKVIAQAVDVYKPTILVADTGGYSKEIITELRRRYGLPISYCDQKDKSFHQRVFANDLRAGYIKVKQHLQIVERFGKIVKNAETGDEVDGQENYSPNAALALYRRVYQTHLSSFKTPLSEEERHIQALEESRYVEETPWFERYD